MCYESWYERKREAEELDKTRKEADKVIEQARAESRKPQKPAAPAAQPVAETEKVTA